ncbi:MAG: indole-3-glycerol phosphate synthase TrpC [Alphaproteobacteria bacterium]|nr:indole-3-glycerol phosphate synthase TrpC [Alphaproteobacteria bacterium]
MTDKLQEICEVKRAHVATQKALFSFSDMDACASIASPTRGFAKALQDKEAAGEIGLICEIKKASPSAGLIRPDFDPATLAKAYEAGGATCLSVLTDEPFFQGHNDFVPQARAACALPVLRKDFMIDVWQVAEARSIGADCILLIMAILGDAQAQDLHTMATGYGMDVLIEVHSAQEMERALRLPSGLIGINNRNLKTLQIDLTMTETLAPMVPKGRTLICESGIQTPQDIVRMRRSGVNGFLIGESLMRQSNITSATQALLKAS